MWGWNEWLKKIYTNLHQALIVKPHKGTFHCTAASALSHMYAEIFKMDFLWVSFGSQHSYMHFNKKPFSECVAFPDFFFVIFQGHHMVSTLWLIKPHAIFIPLPLTLDNVWRTLTANKTSQMCSRPPKVETLHIPELLRVDSTEMYN